MKFFTLVLLTMSILMLSCKGTESKKMLLDAPASPINNIGVQSADGPKKEVIDSLRKDGFHLVSDLREITHLKVKEYREQAKSILNYRKQANSKSWAILTSGKFVYEFVFNSAKMERPQPVQKEEWIKFDDDLRYTYGQGNQVIGQGSYHYDFDETLLLLVDDNENVKPSEFSVKHFNEAALFQGRPTYRDNGFQAKLQKEQ